MTLVSAAYGEDQSFAVELTADGSFVFALAGNTLPLFPLPEMGRWTGSDPARVAHLRRAIAAATAGAADNASKLPDSAYLFVKHGGDPVTKRMYALYDPPAAWAPVQAEILQTVHQAWIGARERTIAAAARWMTPVVAARESSVLVVTFTHTGREPLGLGNPLDPERWSLSLWPEGLGPDQAQAYRRELEEDEISLSPAREPRDDLAMDPGAMLEVRVTLRRQLPPGRFRLRVHHESRVVAEGLRRGGVFTFEPPALVVQS